MAREGRPGILSVIRLTKEERELFLDYLNSARPGLQADYIFALLGDNNFLKFLDVLSNENIKIPSREETLKIINYIKIYKYCQLKGFTEDSYEKAAKVFCKRKMSIVRIVEKVERVFLKLEDFE